MSAQWNLRNPAVKRIVQELKEIQRDDNPDILAEALEENIFEWHFVIRGAWDTEFAGGIYHGRILMPAEYPFKPPAFVMLTPSGRFETGTKICLSISSFHPESWQPSWSVRSALIALIAFMQTPGNGAVGSLDAPADARRQAAAEARATPPKHSNPERQELINSLHQRMLEMEDRSKALYAQSSKPAAEEAEPSGGDAAAAAAAAAETETETNANGGEEGVAIAAESDAGATAAAAAPSMTAPEPQRMPSPPMSPQAPAPQEPPATTPRASAPATPTADLQSPLLAATPPAAATPGSPTAADATAPHSGSWEDRGLTYLAALLALLLAAVLLRRVVLAFAPSSGNNDPLLFSVNPSADVDIEL